MLSKIKLVFGGAIIAAAGSLGQGFLAEDWSALPYGVGAVVVAALSWGVPLGMTELQEYLTKKGYTK